eukprot:CAMPEP_0182917520 /NCGR_PEP_ID=MMETSP0105_2-20130417/1571_1 /TAXON_ID=81532 ORGANISM="Acanthoeca-like sp., Strain 10tr" /NCGR_SAMPLE_ID=MMETSP0105_2 /ASSEMBLY_ACC=CAM_ASM_000205 /LENGTH=290 /DNA_ID=CAMNT_0025054533 /DNA_START=19 /DNA_END=892 /DNA_ORIENTATION=+
MTRLLIATPKVTAPAIEAALTEMRADGADVRLEQLERLNMAQLPLSAFDEVRVGYLDPVETVMQSDTLALLAKVLRPSGKLMLREPAAADTPLGTRLMLAGFVDVESGPAGNLTQATATKPGYEVGSAAQLLSFAVPAGAAAAGGGAAAADVASVWQVSTDDFDDDDLMADDGEGLLDEADKALKTTAPEAADCSTKRRACKDCSCGRAEREAAEDAGAAPLVGPVPTSSLGAATLATLSGAPRARTSGCRRSSRARRSSCRSANSMLTYDVPWAPNPILAKDTSNTLLL